MLLLSFAFFYVELNQVLVLFVVALYRIRWLYKLLMEHVRFGCSSSEGAFSQASFLKLLNASISNNWRAKEIYNEIFSQLKGQCNHSYSKVRGQLSTIMATLLSFDIQYNEEHNMGQGCPKVRDFVNEIIPKLTLNFHNPVLHGTTKNTPSSNGNVCMEHKSTSDSMMEVANTDNSNTLTNTNSKEEANRILESVGTWIIGYIEVSL